MSKLIAIDGDILVYSIAFSVEHNYFTCGGKVYKTKHFAESASKKNNRPVYRYKYYEPEKQIHINLRAKLKKIHEDLGTDNHIIYITSSKEPKNFRNELATILPYKGNRVTLARPFYYKRIRTILVQDYGAIPIVGEEADDALGKLATKKSIEFGDYEHLYIASIDKDLKMIPGYHYSLNSGELVFITPEEAIFNFYMQLIKGDSTDNIPGLYKLLMVSGRVQEARKLITNKYLKTVANKLKSVTTGEYYDIIFNMYKEYGFGIKEVDEIGQLLWIRRDDTGNWGRL